MSHHNLLDGIIFFQIRNEFGCYDQVSTLTVNHSSTQKTISTTSSTNSNKKCTQMSYHIPMDGIIDIDGFRLHHGRRVRRCNWIRFLTVADCKLEGTNHGKGENYNIHQQKSQVERSKVLTTSPMQYPDLNGSHAPNTKLIPNIEGRLTDSGQIVYEVLKTIEASSELVARFRHQENCVTNNNYDAQVDFENYTSKKGQQYPKYYDPTGERICERLPFSIGDLTRLSSSRAIANMLLVDAISAIIKGKSSFEPKSLMPTDLCLLLLYLITFYHVVIYL